MTDEPRDEDGAGPEEPGGLSNEYRLAIWAQRRGVDLELRALEGGHWQAHARFDWTTIGKRTFDLTSAAADSIEEACTNLVEAFAEAGIEGSIDQAVAEWDAELDERLSARGESVTESVTGAGNEGRSSVPE
jgi:hypothetical protein